MLRMGIRQVLGLGILAAWLPSPGWAQPAKNAPPVVTIEEPNAQRAKDELSRLLEHYPPTLRNVLGIDPSLLSNPAFLAPYPALATFLNAHPDIPRSPSFYVGETYERRFNRDQSTSAAERIWDHLIEDLAIFAGFGLAIGVITWLIRTIIDYRRWSRLSKVQTDVHTKLLDRFTGHEELLAYIQSPAGAKFLESSPITLDPGPRRSVGFSGRCRRVSCRWRRASECRSRPADSPQKPRCRSTHWASSASPWGSGSRYRR